MLQRIITASILIGLVIAGVIYLPKVPFATILGLISLVGLWEWTKLSHCSQQWQKWIYLGICAITMYFGYFMPAAFILSIALIAWILFSIFVAKYPEASSMWQRSLIIRLLAGMIAIIPAWYAVIQIRFHRNGIELLFLLLFIIWSVDSAAYFTGKFMGKRRLIPAVSPNKTVEGLLGGFIFAALVAAVYTYIILEGHYFSALFAVCIMATMIIAVMGDLFESAVKRQANVKDSGHILPGHGGICDRLDSLFAAAPIFAFGVSLLDIAY